MKVKCSDGLVHVVGPLTNFPRNTPPPVRPPCFFQVWIDCSDGSAYYVFTDGSIYQYSQPAVDDAITAVRALVHGRTFDQSFRRQGCATPAFKRVTSLPVTARKIYENPPYQNPLRPIPCIGLHIQFNSLTWSFPGAVVTWGNAVAGIPNYFFVDSSDATAGVFLGADGNITGLTNDRQPTLAVQFNCAHMGVPGQQLLLSMQLTVPTLAPQTKFATLIGTSNAGIAFNLPYASGGLKPFTITWHLARTTPTSSGFNVTAAFF